jgi:hypothetical protein
VLKDSLKVVGTEDKKIVFQNFKEYVIPFERASDFF